MSECSGKRVIVTAGAAGIGRVIAEMFRERGATVHVCDVDRAAVAGLTGDGGLVAHVADVSDEGQVDGFMEAALAALGGLDVLVNNAGISGPVGRLEGLAFADWRRTLAVNLDGMFLATRRAIPALTAAGGGSIVNLSSVAGRLGVPLRSPYATSKWGVVGLTKSLASELGSRNISVNAILPGAIEGERFDRVMRAHAEETGTTPEEARAAFLRFTSMRTTITPAEIAEMAVYLACGPGRRISGQSLSVCGNVETLGKR